jgi:hypothetical protein
MTQERDVGSYRLEWINAVRYPRNACREKLDSDFSAAGCDALWRLAHGK